MTAATIYHNPRCSKSRRTLQLLQDADCSIEVIEYLKTPPDAEQLNELLLRLQIPVRVLLRREPVYRELRLDDAELTDRKLLEAVAEHPILLQRPIVVTAKGAGICRPPELVLDLL